MNCTLKEFINKCRVSLTGCLNEQGQDEVLKLVKSVIFDKKLISECFPMGVSDERRVLFEDPELGFCVCGHVYENKKGFPHDHGPTWAIYGQVSGNTKMTDWERVGAQGSDGSFNAKVSRNYMLRPGDVYLYRVGDIHSASCSELSKVIRIEGENTDKIKRSVINFIQ